MSELRSESDIIDVDTFRLTARDWLAANLEARDPLTPAPRRHRFEHKTVESIREERALQHKLYDGGFAGISFPEAYGGLGLTLEHERAFNEEALSYRVPDFGIAGGTTFGVCARTMLAHASPEFLLRHIPNILSGKELWAQFFSEPEAGSDLAGIRTRAIRAGDRWILNGAKVWSSGAYYVDYGMCLARTNWDVPKHRGLTWFAVPTAAPGVTVQPITQIDRDAEFCQEFFDGVDLTDDDIIGRIDDGWTVAQTMLAFERGWGSSQAASRMKSDLAPDLVALAHKAGRDKDPVARQLIAQAHINDYAQQQLSSRIASRMRANGLNAGIAAYWKLAAGTLTPIRVRIAMQIGGLEALAWNPDDSLAKAPSLDYLNGRRMSIAGGTNEMQRNAIGERVLGLPREPSFDSNRPFKEVVRDARDWTGRIG